MLPIDQIPGCWHGSKGTLGMGKGGEEEKVMRIHHPSFLLYLDDVGEWAEWGGWRSGATGAETPSEGGEDLGQSRAPLCIHVLHGAGFFRFP